MIRRIAAEYLQAFQWLLRNLDLPALEQFLQSLQHARRTGATIYIAGNGGSAATASHWVNDLGKATKRPDSEPMRVISLNDNMSWLTALANDEGYERVFSGQLENFARPGDLLIVISASGNSPNLVRAVECAKAREVRTLALLGFDGGMLKQTVDQYILIPTSKGSYGLVESIHGALCHILTMGLARQSAGRLAAHGRPALVKNIRAGR